MPSLLFIPARAESLPIVNFSFEMPSAAAGTFIVSTIAGPPGWSVYNTGGTANNRSFGVLNPSGTQLFPSGATQGSNVGVVFLLNTTNIAEAGLSQTLTSSLQLNTRYTLQVDVGNIGNDPTFPHNSFNFNGFPGYRIDLFAGDTLIGADNNILLPAEGTFLTSTLTFESGSSHPAAGLPLGIRLVNLNGSGVEVNFDNVRLDAVPVPEPVACSLLMAAYLLNRMRVRR